MGIYHITYRDGNGAITTGRVRGKDRASAVRNATAMAHGKRVISAVRIAEVPTAPAAFPPRSY